MHPSKANSFICWFGGFALHKSCDGSFRLLYIYIVHHRHASVQALLAQMDQQFLILPNATNENLLRNVLVVVVQQHGYTAEQ